MRKGLGFFCILLGVCCLLASIGLIFMNRNQEKTAETASYVLLQELQHSEAEPQPETESAPVVTESLPEEAEPEEEAESLAAEPQEMPTRRVSGYDCIGVISFPVFELELPVLTNWNYEKLQLAPCVYYGSYFEPNFVIAAHNHRAHFGRLSELQPGDLVLFTDMSGVVHVYEVALLETLAFDATEQMLTSGFDLSLYTCTPGGASRVTVRCNAVSPN